MVARPHEIEQRFLQRLRIRRRMVVEDDQVEGEPLGAQVFVRVQGLAHERKITRVTDPHDENRQVAADAVSPERALRFFIKLENVRARAQGRVRIDQESGEALVKVRVFDIRLQVAQLDLRARARLTHRALENGCGVILVGKSQRRLARIGDGGRERDARRCARLYANARAQAPDGIEHGAHGVRERAILRDGNGVARRAPAPQEARAVCLVLCRSDCLAFDDHQVYAPDFALLLRARAAARKQRVRFRDELGFDGKVAESRVRRVRRRRVEDDFAVARDFDFTRARRLVRECRAAQLGVVFRRDDDLGARPDACVEPPDFDPVFRERDFVIARRAQSRLKSR